MNWRNQTNENVHFISSLLLRKWVYTHYNACITPKIWSWLMELFIWLVNVCIFKSQKRMELSAVCRRFCIIVQCYIVFTERICQQIYECIRNRIKYLLFFCIFKSDIFHCRLRAISKSMPYAIDCWQIGNLCKVVEKKPQSHYTYLAFMWAIMFHSYIYMYTVTVDRWWKHQPQNVSIN